MSHVKFGNSKIKYQIIRSKRRKTTEIEVDRTGIKVRTPSLKSDKQIKNLIKSHSRWVYHKQIEARQEQSGKITYQPGSKLPYLGKNYLLDAMETNEKEGCTLYNGKFTFKVNRITKYRIQKLYRDWLKKKAKLIIEKQISKYEKKLGVNTSKVSIKNLKNKWGGLSKNGTLNFNQNLIRAPMKVIDYVVAHELCHLRIPNHSQSYWRLLYSIMPDYENKKEWLRIHKSIFVD